MTPDVVFCHGPFLAGDLRVGQTLLQESASVVALCPEPSPEDMPAVLNPDPADQVPDKYPKYRPVSNYLHKRNVEKESAAAATEAPPIPPPPPQKRRLLIVVLGIKPHRTGSAWSTSNRPGESIIRYLLLNGCPAIVIPVKTGCPLIAWDTMTLDSLFKVAKKGQDALEGVVKVLTEYLSLCVDWDRMVIPPSAEAAQDKEKTDSNTKKEETLKDAIGLLIAAAAKSGDSKAVQKDVDADRAGIAMFRIP